jgi:hypothetical protein
MNWTLCILLIYVLNVEASEESLTIELKTNLALQPPQI